MGEICKKTNIEHKKKNGKTLVVKPFLSGCGSHFKWLKQWLAAASNFSKTSQYTFIVTEMSL